MVDAEKMFEEFKVEWEDSPSDLGALFYVARFLKEILAELQAHRPVDTRTELEPVVSAPGVPLDRIMARFDAMTERRMAEVHAPEPKATQTAHNLRLEQVEHTAIEELNVAPQVAVYARRILMGSRPEPDRGVMDTLWGYAAMEVPEGYTLVDKRAAALLELTKRATNDGVHPAAAELARRVLAGEWGTVEVYHKVVELAQGLELGGPEQEITGATETVFLVPPATVLVVDPGVDLEPGDLGEAGQDE